MKIAVLFPGYGSQFVGMAKDLYDSYRTVQEYFEEASHCLNVNAVKLCFASSDATLNKMSNAYTAIFLISSSIYTLLTQEGIYPSTIAGYNDGEYAALFAGGCLSFPDGLYLLNKYSLLHEGAMKEMDVSVVKICGMTTKTLEEFCFKVGSYGKSLVIAMYESRSDHIVSGMRQEVEQLCRLVGVIKEVNIEYLNVAFGLHSMLVDAVAENFSVYLEKVDFNTLSIPMISSLDGQTIVHKNEVRRRIIQHINFPLVFTRVLEKLAMYDILIEAGPRGQVSKIIKHFYPNKRIFSIKSSADIDAIKKVIAG